MELNTILVSTDGSANATRAVEFAGDLASRYGARVVVLHVLLGGSVPEGLVRWARSEHLSPQRKHEPESFDPAYGHVGYLGSKPEDSVTHEDLRAIGEAILRDAESRLRQAGAGDVHTALEEGDTAKAVVSAADREDAGLVVMGTRGYGEIEGLLLGSVSHKVLGHARRPCLIVP